AGEDVGTIPVPPKYGQGDFADKASWKLRGKLDVPKERFVAYPGLGRDTDPTPLVGWAGWDHLQCAQALAATYEQRRSVDGWTPERLTPILAGMAELVPWLRQWHNDVDPATGLRLGDFFAEFVATESAANGVGADDLAAWKPPARTARTPLEPCLNGSYYRSRAVVVLTACPPKSFRSPSTPTSPPPCGPQPRPRG
ncbi:MAG: hypothetical protein M3066_07765, partial [Actinomycetota bacterium]|nr:hypothetical protein [Actinomycetota bacterium]